MSLINCPECNKEISDKAHKCIHCGYPLTNIKNENNMQSPFICKINGQNYDLKQVMDIMKSDKSKTYETLKNITNLDRGQCAQLLLIINNINGIPSEFNSGDTLNSYQRRINANIPVTCPQCGSTNIQVVRKKFSLLTGFATNKVERVCANCLHKF